MFDISTDWCINFNNTYILIYFSLEQPLSSNDRNLMQFLLCVVCIGIKYPQCFPTIQFNNDFVLNVLNFQFFHLDFCLTIVCVCLMTIQKYMWSMKFHSSTQLQSKKYEKWKTIVYCIPFDIWDFKYDGSIDGKTKSKKQHKQHEEKTDIWNCIELKGRWCTNKSASQNRFILKLNEINFNLFRFISCFRMVFAMCSIAFFFCSYMCNTNIYIFSYFVGIYR